MALGRILCCALALLGALVLFPGAASAHGPVAPVASSYLAEVRSVPAGVDAKIVDGDQRLWLSVKGSATVVVLDYQGAPYLRFAPAGVSVNRHSAMYYLNQTPSRTPPPDLNRSTPPDWQPASRANDYLWHDGRLHALASVATVPGASFVGTWRIPVLVDRQPSAISGTLRHADDPSIVWFWPILVVLSCLLAAVRLRDSALERRLARVFGIAGVAALAVGGIGRELYGRPNVDAFQLAVVGVLAVFVLWALPGAWRARYFALLLVAFVALWIGGLLVPTLLHGFVLTAIPAFLTRVAAVGCLTAGPALIVLVFRLAIGEDASDRERDEIAVGQRLA
jgi:hypothetical protein